MYYSSVHCTGLVAGATAIASRKGGPIHRRAGKVFLVSMFIAYLIGAFVAPFLSEGQRPNFVAAILALYLLITGVMTARRRHFQASIMEKIGLAVALLITGMGVLFAYMGIALAAQWTVHRRKPLLYLLSQDQLQRLKKFTYLYGASFQKSRERFATCGACVFPSFWLQARFSWDNHKCSRIGLTDQFCLACSL